MPRKRRAKGKAKEKERKERKAKRRSDRLCIHFLHLSSIIMLFACQGLGTDRQHNKYQ